MWARKFLCLLAMLLSFISTAVESLPVKQWPVVPNRQRHWTGILYMTNPVHAATRPPPPANSEYEAFLKAKASGKNPTATYRPDSWSKFNYHLDPKLKDLKARGQHVVPAAAPARLLSAREENATACNVSLTPLHYCPRTLADLEDDYREMRRGLYAGTIIAFLGAFLMLVIWFISTMYFAYFDRKERWYIERARLRSIKKVNLNLIASGIDPFPENTDEKLLQTPPSEFWASIFETEWFIALLYFIERRTKSKGKYTDRMTRPKLGDESSGIPLNSLRARRKYGKKGPTVAPLLNTFGLGTTRKVSGSELPTPVGSLHRRGRSSRMASINSILAQSNKDTPQTGPVTRVEPTSSGQSYQVLSGFGESPWNGSEARVSGEGS
ncbi:hypothetical protein DRE_05229 [Drechslerella stenobrocha 248]|uniref:Uncharacterized protein n=1 Tax=Drechslerella stenobrocha 248 TaxID=1043628 RepID=W7I0D3_9PEZI|nr:hypothetical protein DRE_05229 [Drechslerella stenobrocha 248]